MFNVQSSGHGVAGVSLMFTVALPCTTPLSPPPKTLP